MRAYALSKRPQPLYNTARAYEEMGQHRKAVAMFRLYLEQVPPDSDGALAAIARIEQLDKPPPEEATPVQPEAEPVTGQAVAAPQPATAVVAAEVTNAKPTSPLGSVLLWSGAVTTGVSAAVLYAMARSKRLEANEMVLHNDNDQRRFDERVEASSKLRTASVVLLGASAACATLAWWRGRPAADQQALAPTLTPWRRGFVATWRY